MTISTVRDLRPDPKNRRRHNPRNVGMLVEALQAVGAARSIVIDESDTVLAGNGVLEAAAEAGITAVQVVDVDGSTLVAVRRRDLSPDQKRALAIYDNRTAELAEWNVAQLQEDAAAGLDLQPFWTEAELAAAFAANRDLDASYLPDASPTKGMKMFAVVVTPDQFDRIQTTLKRAIDAGLGKGPEGSQPTANALVAILDQWLP